MILQFNLRDYLDANDPRFERDTPYDNGDYNLAVPDPAEECDGWIIVPVDGGAVMAANDAIIPPTGGGYMIVDAGDRATVAVGVGFDDPGHALGYLLGEPLEVVETNPDSDDDYSCRVLTGSHSTESWDRDHPELGDFIIFREGDGTYSGRYEGCDSEVVGAPSAEAILAHVFRGYDLEPAAA